MTTLAADKSQTIESSQVNTLIQPIRKYLLSLQNNICTMLETEENSRHFITDEWQHAAGGGGYSCVLADGDVIEKAGVNFSHVSGFQLPPTASEKRPQLAGAICQAIGVSVVVHPRNPYAPTSHMNVRCIFAELPNGEVLWWFGGGFDLTPYYGFDEDCQHWHRMAKAACDPFGSDLYEQYKHWCDKYFYLPHRQEPRGIGGLFFDDLNTWEFNRCFEFMQQIGNHYILAYQPILNRRKHHDYGQRQRDFQCYRRGRYVEFNLLYDRGTLFGLQSGGRTESILMSLPPQVNFIYQWQPQADSPEEQLYKHYLQPKSWL